MTKRLLTICVACWLPLLAAAQAKKTKAPLPPVSWEKGQLAYQPDEKGNRVPDFSWCGYMAGEQALPLTPIRVRVPVMKGDATATIQAALDYVASLPLKEGVRGAVLLDKGTFEISGSLRINASGVVLRGSGDSTVLLATGYSRAILIHVSGRNDKQLSPAVKITDAYVPVNSHVVHIPAGVSLQEGDEVEIVRPCTPSWIQQLGTAHFGGGITALGWKPGDREIHWSRKVMKVTGNTVTLDVPLTNALDTAYGSATIAAYKWPGLITQTGVENLHCRSVFDAANPKDEDHCWTAIAIENATDAWVRQVSFEHFAGSAVAVLETARRVTVEDCISTAPVSEIGGQRRYTFFTAGQQTLFQRNYAQYGYHDFAAGFCAAGPNAFVQCMSDMPYSFSGAIDSWATGLLLDNVIVNGQTLGFPNRGQDGQGAGWTAANSVLWQCAAARIDCYRPPSANNWAFGAWAQFAGDGEWYASNEYIQPRSLYYAQLSARLGDKAAARAYLLPELGDASSSPTADVAAALSRQSMQPATTLYEWIGMAATRTPIPVNADGARIQAPVKQAVSAAVPGMKVVNGWLVNNGDVMTGDRRDVSWWRGNIRPDGIQEATPHITRYVPGRTGTGLTDDLDSVSAWMSRKHIVAIDHNYGLWYERRRDDHERVLRLDGDVWPPFYEQPFARSGQGTAWEGLSKYDLTKYNRWYWYRLQQFATLADRNGQVLIHQQYFQHNIIEAGAHYADFPWRPANNINQTGFPEPPPYAGGKRIFMAEQFYDTTNAVRNKLHRAYIRQCLDNFSNNHNVIQLIGAEFTGPLHFVDFWADVVRGWEQEKQQHSVIGLSTTKDVQDAVLQDAQRAPVIDLIDIRYWHYQENGTVYAPQGGQNLAPRQHARLLKPKRSNEKEIYRAVREYRDLYPGKAVMYSADSYDKYGWAVFMAGGSLASIPSIAVPGFLSAAAGMHPADMPGLWALSNNHGDYIIYNAGAANIDIPGATAAYNAVWIDAVNGRTLLSKKNIKAGTGHTLSAPQAGAQVLWLIRK
ncbi:DUF6298 domain-containing protein [Chitinophaga pinensis]|uniref:DUF6298 domain-containing protein n=1 Tax=Chitinophaga pinensis (strain ATCC 43595 / DSM 2588 / LMG 13176 / NBRC 15968 / NCIMB 11800 / UQM 2034) TaxID=485918 RepID=A0A979GSA1_CHIPD|nr:DUF6298 domain-containing protein [Chitinophaga pinensis]ACU59299.1 hypothetical protein Cpin_1803 [Chitinophaga pinensis DSM 2588]